jgi:hypothetical protein
MEIGPSCKHIITKSADDVIKEEGGRQKND